MEMIATRGVVPNERIAMLKLEKIVDPELHADTKQEKAQKIIDAIQSSDISNNKLEIDKLKGYESVNEKEIKKLKKRFHKGCGAVASGKRKRRLPMLVKEKAKCHLETKRTTVLQSLVRV